MKVYSTDQALLAFKIIVPIYILYVFCLVYIVGNIISFVDFWDMLTLYYCTLGMTYTTQLL